MRVLITGICGFAGSHLAEYLTGKKNIEIHGTDMAMSNRAYLRLFGRRVRFYPCDVLKYSALRSVIKKSRPDRIFHLAGQASVEMSWKRPEETFAANVFGSRNLFEALRAERMNPLIHIAASSEEYGLCRADEMPINEETPLRPLTPYAVSKVAQDYLGCQYWLAFKLNIVRTRAFNHTGPGQSDSFVASHFARQVALIEAGCQKPVIGVGNTNAIRDFTDVRDVVRAYWLALERCEVGQVYNVCTGVGRRIGDILDFFLSQSRILIKVRRDRARLRARDIPEFVGDPRKFIAQSRWRPEIPFERSLKDLLDDWRGRVSRQKDR